MDGKRAGSPSLSESFGEAKEEKGKFVSLLLRHNPPEFGLTVDNAGWAKVEDILRICGLTTEELNFLVENNNKSRYAYSDDRSIIRARQGHSIKVDLGFEPIEPPELLFHGTADRFLEVILREGLLPMSRLHVHLSPDVETAHAVGVRHGTPVILSVDSARMYSDGLKFYRAENGVWLTVSVPPEYLRII